MIARFMCPTQMLFMFMSFQYGPITHIAVENDWMFSFPDAMKSVCGKIHDIAFGFDFYKSAKSGLSRAYLAHLVMDKLSYSNSSLVKNTDSKYHREGQLYMDSFNYVAVSKQKLDLDRFAGQIFDFLEYSGTKYSCQPTLETVRDALGKFVDEVQLERAGM